jgi:hypothetical protein
MLADAAADGADADGCSDVASAGGAAGALAAAAPAKAAHELTLYWEYLAFIFGRLEEVSEQERVESGYRDYLQARGCADAGRDVCRHELLTSACNVCVRVRWRNRRRCSR